MKWPAVLLLSSALSDSCVAAVSVPKSILDGGDGIGVVFNLEDDWPDLTRPCGPLRALGIWLYGIPATSVSGNHRIQLGQFRSEKRGTLGAVKQQR